MLGYNFTFSIPQQTTLAAGGFLILAADRTAFLEAYSYFQLFIPAVLFSLFSSFIFYILYLLFLCWFFLLETR